MKRYTTIVLAATALVAAGCKDNPVANPIDAPTVDALSGALTRVTLQQLATGVLAQDRASANVFAYALEAGIFARDVYRIDASEPRFVQETLGDSQAQACGAASDQRTLPLQQAHDRPV